LQGLNASRWLVLFIGISFQTSTLASVVLLFTFVARYLSKSRETPITLKLYGALVAGILYVNSHFAANFSTTALIFAMVLMLVFIGKYPLKYRNYYRIRILFLTFFVVLSKAFPDSKLFSRVQTWESGIENFSTDKPDEDDYKLRKQNRHCLRENLGLVQESVQKNFYHSRHPILFMLLL
jgi:cell division protein FtsW